ncbi:hypothetical protein niasHT_007324 [Heterodera trifolii]|uniref:Rho GTPase-activating protein syd-1 n=1 Tax=Heterodera trifolii TaxID=157864 RepID=A0ABD2LLH3_9BILA
MVNRQMKQPQLCEHVPGPSSSAFAGELPEGVYRQLRKIDQQTSTLTARGVQGFSARVLNREEYKTPKYGSGSTYEIRVVQLVEIIKKPGQSLGLYLREGNGIDQFTGVFVSRFGEKSELQKCGDILRPGDQILAVNNVFVREMAIDDVVLMLSIPRRLLLRTSFIEEQRDQLTIRGPTERSEQRPVVVFQKMPETEHRRDSEASNSGILAKPASTAASWLGKKVRQQQQLKKQQKQQQSDQAQQQLRHRQYPQQQQQQPMMWTDGADAVAQTARIPPPRVQPIPQPRVHPPPFFPSSSMPPFVCPTPSQRLPFASATLGRLPPSASAPLQRRHLFGAAPLSSSCCHPSVPPHSVIGAPSIPPASLPFAPPSHFTQQNAPLSMLRPFPLAQNETAPFGWAQSKSNSLPRRKVQPDSFAPLNSANIRWRADIAPSASFARPSNAPGASLPFYANPRVPSLPSGGAFSDIEVGRQRRTVPSMCNGAVVGGTGRTVADIFSAKEYRNWASEDEDDVSRDHFGGGRRRTRWTEATGRMGAQTRSNSLPPKAILMDNHFMGPAQNNFEQSAQNAFSNAERMSPAEKADILDRLHVSPLTNRRVPLRTAGPGFDVDGLSVANSLSGILSVTIVEGRNLKVPDRVHSKQLYCVLEVDEQHRARTGISTPEQHFRWAERFDIDILNATNASFFIYAWHPKLRHRFCHKGDIRLMDAFLVEGFGTNRMFTLQLEPRGQLLLKVAFSDLAHSFCRIRRPSADCGGVFGQPLNWLVEHENVEVPVVLNRLVTELERRGVDTAGLYFLCGADERKLCLRRKLEENSAETDIGERPVPDPNILTCLVKDFLRELPEPLVPFNIYSMLLDATSVMPSIDREENQKLVMRIVDCLATPNKNSLVFLMAHFRALLASEPHNGLTAQKLSVVFGPLLFCSSAPPPNSPPVSLPFVSPKAALSNPSDSLLNAQHAAKALRLLLDYWPRVNGSFDSNSSSAGGAAEDANGGGGTEEKKRGDGGRGPTE